MTCLPFFINKNVNKQLDLIETQLNEIHQIYANIEKKLDLLQNQLYHSVPIIQNDLETIRSILENHEVSPAPWVNKMASVVIKTGASIVTHQPALTPWASIMKLFTRDPIKTTT